MSPCLGVESTFRYGFPNILETFFSTRNGQALLYWDWLWPKLQAGDYDALIMTSCKSRVRTSQLVLRFLIDLYRRRTMRPPAATQHSSNSHRNTHHLPAPRNMELRTPSNASYQLSKGRETLLLHARKAYAQACHGGES